MIEQVGAFNSSLTPEQNRITVSVEIEKTREPLYQLFPHGDVVRPSAQATPTWGPCSLIIILFYNPVYILFSVPPPLPRSLSVRMWLATLASGQLRRR